MLVYVLKSITKLITLKYEFAKCTGFCAKPVGSGPDCQALDKDPDPELDPSKLRDPTAFNDTVIIEYCYLTIGPATEHYVTVQD